MARGLRPKSSSAQRISPLGFAMSRCVGRRSQQERWLVYGDCAHNSTPTVKSLCVNARHVAVQKQFFRVTESATELWPRALESSTKQRPRRAQHVLRDQQRTSDRMQRFTVKMVPRGANC
jgi:hypothetical protein